MVISYTQDNTHVVDSYLIDNIELSVMEIIRERHIKHLQVTRDFDSYVREWRGHNRLYKLHLFRSHTKDVDLQEPSSLLNEIIWLIIGGV